MDEKPRKRWSIAGVGTITALLLVGWWAAIQEKQIRERHAMLNRLTEVAHVFMKSEHDTVVMEGVEPTTIQKGGRLPLGLELFGEPPVGQIAFGRPPDAELSTRTQALFPEAEIWTWER